MKWWKNLYISEKWQESKVSLCKQIEKKETGWFWYLICLSDQEADPLVIWPASILKQKDIDSNRMYVVGVAKGKREAFRLIAGLFLDVKDEDCHFVLPNRANKEEWVEYKE